MIQRIKDIAIGGLIIGIGIGIWSFTDRVSKLETALNNSVRILSQQIAATNNNQSAIAGAINQLKPGLLTMQRPVPQRQAAAPTPPQKGENPAPDAPEAATTPEEASE